MFQGGVLMGFRLEILFFDGLFSGYGANFSDGAGFCPFLSCDLQSVNINVLLFLC